MPRVNTPKALQNLVDVASSIDNQYLQQAKDEGKKIVGFLYQETPIEILSAAGLVPYFIRGTGSEGTEYSEAFFRQLTCNYVRHTFNQIMDGKLDFLDGAVFYNSCDHARRIYDNWIELPDSPAYHFMYIPKKRDELTKEFYREEVKKFIEATEKKFGVKITDEDLKKAIEQHNEIRRLQAELYEMQKGKQVYLTGTELMLVMIAGLSMPAEQYIAQLKELIAELKANGETFEPAIRLLFTGGHVDSKEFMELLESQGGQIVVDNTSFGSRMCAKQISTDKAPLDAIIDYYWEEMPAATRQIGTTDERMERIGQLIKDYGVDGVISSRIFMCDIWAFEQYIMRKYLAQLGTPSLELEVDYVPDAQGQIRTRVQAFIESIRSQKN